MNSSPSKPANNHQRQNVISWPDYFMATAFLAAKRSKDPATQVGACIVNPENRVVGIGYNGFPHGCSDSEFPWAKDTPNPLDSKYMYVVHAEVNAILNKNCADVNGCTIYVALFPCNECAKVIIQSRIKEVVYMSDKHADKASTVASKRLFDSAGVKCTQFYPTQNSIVIDFSEIEWSNLNQVPATPKKSTDK